ncbi:MAG: phosphoribosyltransferase family protein [Paenibacillus sp.]|jgi:hypothetical protein|nr:phosphoribosyltransferase family protein [Paenibacillus sp.]
MNLHNARRRSFRILDDLEVSIEITSNPFELPLETLFEMAARINKKRSFLFVSKVLGKHFPVNPYTPLMGGALLGLLFYKQKGYGGIMDQDEFRAAFLDPKVAEKIYQRIKSSPLELPDSTLFIGFAETATALGHSMFDIFSGPTKYIHTTRENVSGSGPSISFEEEHSHATSHRCYTLDHHFFKDTAAVVLVDDEITTGKTALNIIRQLHAKSPTKEYIVASLLDWRSEEDKERFKQVERELKISITCLSVLGGKILVNGNPVDRDYAKTFSHSGEPQIFHHSAGHHFEHTPFASLYQDGSRNERLFLKETGRFGLSGNDGPAIDERISRCASDIRNQRRGRKALCMGTGEFMYLPMRIAAEMGEEIFYQSSTRSPIHPYNEGNYTIRNCYSFQSHDDHSVINFFYNIDSGMYDEVFVFVERVASIGMLASLTNALKGTGIPIIHFVHFDNIQTEG